MPNLKNFTPIPGIEMRPRYAPEKHIYSVWLAITFGTGPLAMSACPDVTPETPAILRALADEIDALLAEKADHDDPIVEQTPSDDSMNSSDLPDCEPDQVDR